MWAYKIYLCNLLGLSIRTSMQNLESVAQKMAELLHNYERGHYIYLSILSGLYSRNFLVHSSQSLDNIEIFDEIYYI